MGISLWIVFAEKGTYGTARGGTFGQCAAVIAACGGIRCIVEGTIQDSSFYGFRENTLSGRVPLRFILCGMVQRDPDVLKPETILLLKRGCGIMAHGEYDLGEKNFLQHVNDLGRDDIKQLVLRVALPSMLAQFVSVLYSIVDRMYIGNIPEIGDTALAGVESAVQL